MTAPEQPPPVSAKSIYFLTLQTQDHQPWLALPRTREVLLSVLRAWHAQRHGRLLVATIMPDHVHVLVELDESQSVAQLVSGWKSALRMGAGYAETFQEKFLTRRLDDPAETEEYALYSFLRPYRAKHCEPAAAWPGNWLPVPEAFRFVAELDAAGCPPADWIAWPAERFAQVSLGE